MPNEEVMPLVKILGNYPSTYADGLLSGQDAQRDADLNWLVRVNKAGGKYYHDGKWWKTFEFQIPVEEWEKCQTKK